MDRVGPWLTHCQDPRDSRVRVLCNREPVPSMVMVDAQTVNGCRYGPTFHAAGRGGRVIGMKRTLLVEILGLPVAAAACLTGKGDSVVNLAGWPSGITTINNRSQSNFAVQVYSEEGDYLDLLVNEIGSYSGEAMLPGADPMVLVIQDVGGTWSFSAVQQ